MRRIGSGDIRGGLDDQGSLGINDDDFGCRRSVLEETLDEITFVLGVGLGVGILGAQNNARRFVWVVMASDPAIVPGLKESREKEGLLKRTGMTEPNTHALTTSLSRSSPTTVTVPVP
jgi:hypothetical protein